MTDCMHEWIVFSTALQDICLMVECARCHAFGTVDNPTAEEWSEAYYAPSHPYRWWENDRVTVRGTNRVQPYIEGPKDSPVAVI